MEGRPRSVHEGQIVVVTPWGQVTRWLSQSMVNAVRSKPLLGASLRRVVEA
jgi:hypothetical protein